jgi:hypothetical protein
MILTHLYLFFFGNQGTIDANLQAGDATLTADIDVIVQITADLQAANATITADIDNIVTITADLQAGDATLNSDIDVIVQIDADLQAGDATLNSDIDVIVQINADLQAGNATTEPDIDVIVQLTAALQAGDATLTADIDNIATINAALQAGDATLNSDIDAIVTIDANLQAGDATLTADINAIVQIQSNLQAGNATLLTDIVTISGAVNAALQAGNATLSADIDHPGVIYGHVVGIGFVHTGLDEDSIKNELCDGIKCEVKLVGPLSANFNTGDIDRYKFVKLRTLTNIDILIDGPTLATDNGLLPGDLIWVSNQSIPSENGVYRLNNSLDLIFYTSETDTFIDEGITALDVVDGDIKLLSVVSYGSVDYDRIGIYYITYAVTNTAGITSVIKRRVKITDPNSSIIPVGGLKITQYDVTAGFDKNLINKN